MTDAERLYHLALRDVHAAAGATFVNHGDWSLPEHYGDAEAESRALREACVVFDRSHRSRIMVTGTDAPDVLAAVFAGRIDELEEGRAMRTVSLTNEGHISDLVLIARTGGIAYVVSGEPGQREAARARLNAAASQPDFDARVDDRTETTCLLALAGPSAERVAREHLSDGLPARLRSMHSATFFFHGFRTLATRTSDTGEDGFEFLLAPAVAQHIFETLRTAGIVAAGWMATEAARIEACIPAYDPDLATCLSPAEADLDALLDIPGGTSRRILSAMLFDSVDTPAVGAPVISDGRIVGEVRSACRSWSLGATIGLSLLDVAYSLPGTELSVGGKRANITSKPLFRRRHD